MNTEVPLDPIDTCIFNKQDLANGTWIMDSNGTMGFVQWDLAIRTGLLMSVIRQYLPGPILLCNDMLAYYKCLYGQISLTAQKRSYSQLKSRKQSYKQ